jgi:hypothetical protein
MSAMEISDVKTRIFLPDREIVLDVAIWPECGLVFPYDGGGSATEMVQSTVEGKSVSSVNLVFTNDGRAFIDVQVA